MTKMRDFNKDRPPTTNVRDVINTHGCEGVSKWEIPPFGHVDRGIIGKINWKL